LEAFIGSLNGKRIVRGTVHGKPEHSEELGLNLATMLLSQGGKTILDEIRVGNHFNPTGEA
jgi:hypothetical protein